jgi:hypothetical protein
VIHVDSDGRLQYHQMLFTNIIDIIPEFQSLALVSHLTVKPNPSAWTITKFATRSNSSPSTWLGRVRD